MADTAVVIDKDRCVGCGACVDDCFPGALRLAGGVAAWSGRCIECGHCVAVCPRGAVSFAGYDMAQVEAYDPAGCAPDAAVLANALKFRRSIRSYEARPLSDEVVGAMADAVRYTPTACNAQGTSLVVVREGMEDPVNNRVVGYKYMDGSASAHVFNRLVDVDAVASVEVANQEGHRWVYER